MAPLRPGLSPVRRGGGLAAVLLLLGCAVVFYRVAPSFPTSGSSTPTSANSSAGPPQASDPRPTTSTTTPGAGHSTGSGLPEQTIQVEYAAYSAKPFQTVRIQGTYRGGANTFVRVQRLEEGRWLAFPFPAKTDHSGRFTLYVELGQPGRYWLRVLDAVSGVKSKSFVLVIKA
jgi:hypothetical protein